jgi:outer membrane protein
MPIKTKIILEGVIEPRIEKVNDFEQIEEIALNNRPEIKQRNLKIESASKLVDYYKNQMLPDFNLQASIGYSGLGGSKSDDYSSAILGPPSIDSKYDDGFSDSISNLRSGDNIDWSIGASLTIPLGNDDAKGKLQSNVASKAREVILLEQLLDQVALEARSSWRDVVSNLRNIDSTKIAFELQKEILENEQERFNIGLSKTNDVLEAQKELEQAELIYNKAIADYNLSLSKYKFSLGTLIKDNMIILDD